MNNYERVKNLVNRYVEENGNQTEMNRNEFLEWVHETYNNISAASNNLYPTDLSFNLYNLGLKDFPDSNLCLLFIRVRNTFRLVGSDYKYTGPVYQYKGKANEKIIGQWNNGVFKMNHSDIDLPENILLRRQNLERGLKNILKEIPVIVNFQENRVDVYFQDFLISGISIEEECYRIYNASPEWKNKSDFCYEQSEDGTWYCYIDTMDECIDEMRSLVIFEAKKTGKTCEDEVIHSELRENLTLELFEKVFNQFVKQADANAKSGKSKGSKNLIGVLEDNEFDGATLTQHFGQGNASKTPYINWWVVSIYYIPFQNRIVMGIEEERYSHIKDMSPVKYERFDNRNGNIAVFYETSKDSINYTELYENFLSVSEEVMMLGLH